MFLTRSLKTLLIAATCGVAACSTTSANADEDLFSEIKINSVFSEAADGEEKKESTVREERVRSVDHLGRLLRIEGFGFEKVGDRTYGAIIEVDDWSFPTLVTLSQDGSRIGFIAGLVLYNTDEKRISTDEMLKLLSANQSIAPYQFGFNESRKRTELTRAIDNRDVDSTVLSREIKLLAEVARDNSDAWYTEKSETEESKTTTETAETPQTPEKPAASLSPSSLVGLWVASRSETEAFGLQMTSSGSFSLAFVKDGKTTVSKGTFGLQGSELVLSVSNGGSLKGPVVIKSKDQFDFTPVGGSPLTFSRTQK